MAVAERTLGRLLPPRFLAFCLVGSLGMAVHLAVLALLYRAGGVEFLYGQAVAALCAMTFNSVFNNGFTYRERRLRGGGLIRGLLSFYLIFGIGAALNVYAANHVFGLGVSWVAAGMSGAAIGAVWNYATTAMVAWRERGVAAGSAKLPATPTGARPGLPIGG